MKNNFLLTIILFFVMIYILSSMKQIRFDLTNDKRYSLSKSSIAIIKKIKNPVKFEIFLSGDLPSGMIYLKSEILRKMVDIQNYNKSNITYEFINIDALDDDKKKVMIEKLLFNGVNPTDLVYNSNQGRVIKRVFPAILINSERKTETILLLSGDKRGS